MQQRASFGRKGQGSEEPIRQPISLGVASDASDMDRHREEFIAAERARRQQESHYDAPVDHDEGPTRPFVEKSVGTAYILWFVTGPFAGHLFYLGKASLGFAQIGLRLVGIMMFVSGDSFGLYLLGAAFLWLLADAVMLPEMTRKANDKAKAIASGRAFA